MKGRSSPPALRIKVQLRQDHHTSPLLPVQAIAAGGMAEEQCLDMQSQPAQSGREICCLVVPISGFELNGKHLWSSPRGPYRPPGMSILEVLVFASPNTLRPRAGWSCDWWTDVHLSHSCGSTNCWPFLFWFESSQISLNIIVISYTFRKNSWPVEKREVIMLSWGEENIKYKNVGTIWVWGYQAETSSGKGPSA